MILITGATGHLGLATIEHLLKNTNADQIIALARTEEKAKALRDKGLEVRIGDFDDIPSLDKAVQGVEKVLLISTGDVSRLQQHKNVVDAATRAGIKHIVYTSVAMHDVDTSPIKFLMESHFQTEDYIKESGLSYTLMRNTLYADTIPMFAGEKVLETGIYLPAANGKISFALRDEMAEAIARVLTTAGHENKTYSLTNSETYTYQDVAEILTEISGKQVSYFSPVAAEYVETLTNAGVPKPYVDMFLGFALAIAKNEFDLVTNDLEQLLGRKPASVKAYLKTIY